MRKRKTSEERPADLEIKSNVPATTNDAKPAYLQNMPHTGGIEGLDSTDMVIPRIKLLQGISPEVEAHNEAKAGLFWHNVLNIPLGTEFRFVVCKIKKRYLLMAPLNDPRGVLARADDAIHWNPPNETFEVKLKGVKEVQKWTTKPTVKESGLAEFGSSIAGDSDSKPAAVLVYEYLVYLPDFPEMSPIVMSLARSQARKGKDLNSKISMRGAPLQSMMFKASVIEENGDEGPYKNYMFMNAGWATEAEFERCKQIAEAFSEYKAADEGEVAQEPNLGKNAEY